MPFDPDKPYNDLLLLAPKAELKGAGELIPNQGVLINAIVLQEAKTSSATESLVPGTTTCAGAGICSRNEHIVRICPKNPSYWRYPKNMASMYASSGRTYMAFDRDAMFDELLKTFEECREPNWDGYGAQGVREKTYHLACKFLAALPLAAPEPSIGAEPDGHITVEWYRSPQRTVSVSISPDGKLHYAALVEAERICGTETFRDTIPQPVQELITRIEKANGNSFSR